MSLAVTRSFKASENFASEQLTRARACKVQGSPLLRSAASLKSCKELSKFPKKSSIPPRILQQHEIIKMELSGMGVVEYLCSMKAIRLINKNIL